MWYIYELSDRNNLVSGLSLLRIGLMFYEWLQKPGETNLVLSLSKIPNPQHYEFAKAQKILSFSSHPQKGTMTSVGFLTIMKLYLCNSSRTQCSFPSHSSRIHDLLHQREHSAYFQFIQLNAPHFKTSQH